MDLVDNVGLGYMLPQELFSVVVAALLIGMAIALEFPLGSMKEMNWLLMGVRNRYGIRAVLAFVGLYFRMHQQFLTVLVSNWSSFEVLHFLPLLDRSFGQTHFSHVFSP